MRITAVQSQPTFKSNVTIVDSAIGHASFDTLFKKLEPVALDNFQQGIEMLEKNGNDDRVFIFPQRFLDEQDSVCLHVIKKMGEGITESAQRYFSFPLTDFISRGASALVDLYESAAKTSPITPPPSPLDRWRV